MAELPFLCSMLLLLALETMHEAVNKLQHQILQTEKHTSVTQYVMYVFMCYKHLSFSIYVCVCVFKNVCLLHTEQTGQREAEQQQQQLYIFSQR